jgi:hypothetical protein
MKVHYSKKVQRYIVSHLGEILHYCVSLDDALRLAGIEPSEDDYDLDD